MKTNKNYQAEWAVVGRVVSGVTVLEYVIKNRNGQLKRVPKDTFDNLALNGQIYNCSANIYNNRVNLRGIGMKIKDLPTKNVRR